MTLKIIVFSAISSFMFAYSMTPDEANKQLLDAAKNNNREQVQEALHNNANINTQDAQGHTPFYRAIISATFKNPKYSPNFTEVAQFLIDQGANINIQNADGWTPLHWAALRGNIPVVQLLLENKIDYTLKDKDGNTPLEIAKENNHQELVKILEEYALHKEARERPTKATLKKAIQGNYPNIVRLLLQHNIPADEQDLQQAKKLDHKEIGRMLVQYLSLTPDMSTISKKGIGLPTNIAQHIMGYAI